MLNNHRASKMNMARWTIYLIVILLILGLSIYVGLFLYENFTKSLNYSHKVEDLNTDWKVKADNIHQFDTIKEQLKEKTKEKKADFTLDFY